MHGGVDEIDARITGRPGHAGSRVVRGPEFATERDQPGERVLANGQIFAIVLDIACGLIRWRRLRRRLLGPTLGTLSISALSERETPLRPLRPLRPFTAPPSTTAAIADVIVDVIVIGFELKFKLFPGAWDCDSLYKGS